MRRFRVLFLIAIALWLPLQTAASWAMPLCRHAAEHATAHENMDMTSHCHMATDDTADVAATPAGDLDCDNCEICHLASAGFLLVANAASLAAPSPGVLVPGLKPATPSHIGDPPLQPPRRTN